MQHFFYQSSLLPSKRAAMPQIVVHGKSPGKTKSSAPVRSRISGTMLIKTKLAPPRMVRYTAASPSFALPRTSLNRTWSINMGTTDQRVCQSTCACILSAWFVILTLYIAAVDADPTTREMPMTEWLWKPSAYVIMTMPPMAKIAATICD